VVFAGPWTTIATAVRGAAFTGPGLISEISPPLMPLLNGSYSTATATVEVQDTISTSAAPRRFMRLCVNR